MLHRLVLSLAASLALLAQVPLDDTGKEGTLEVLVVDAFGKPLQGSITLAVREIVNGVLGREVRIAPKDTLKYGTYRLTVRGSPAYPVDKVVKIDKRFQLVVAALFLAPIEEPWAGSTIRGRLPAKSMQGRCHWGRQLSAVSEAEYAEGIALDSGAFILENVKPGKYIFVSIGPAGICDITSADVVPGREQEIRFP